MDICLHTDASDYGWGCYLFQKDREGKEWPVHFLSQAFNDVQSRWSTAEKECYAIFQSMRKLEHLLQDRKFILRTDHRNLLFLNAQPSAKVTRWKLAIQEFDFTIEHIPGKDNIVADHMSRLCAAPPHKEPNAQRQHDSQSKIACEASGSAGGSDTNPTICMTCTPVSTMVAVSESSSSSQAGPDERMAEEVQGDVAVPRHPETPTEHTGQHANNSNEFYRITDSAYKIIKAVHNASSGEGHLGVDRTIEAVKNYIQRHGLDDWPTLRRDCEEFRKRCPICQRQDQRRPPLVTAPYLLSTKDKAMRHMAIDTMGPFPPDKDGNTYIIAMVDRYSRFLEMAPTKDATAQSAAEWLVNNHFAYFGVPQTIHSDNGPQYVNSIMNTISQRTGVRFTRSTPYSHEENGLIERLNKEILRHLRSIMYERKTREHWSTACPIVMRLINSQKHSITGLSPSQIITPLVDTRAGLIYPHPDDPSETEADQLLLSSHLQELQEHLESLVTAAFASQTLLVVDDTGMPIESSFNEGDFVMLSYPKDTRPPSKLHSLWRGPFRIIKKDGATYKIASLSKGTTQDVHISRLKKYIHDPDFGSPLEVACQDDDYYIVSKILGHKGSPKARSSLKFLVSWVGYDDSSNSWLPYADLKNNAVLHAYLREHNMVSLIPAIHR
jgi:hypothetical protein